MHKQNLVKLYPFVLKILHGNEIMTDWWNDGQSKKEGKDQEWIQSSTTPDPGYQW